MVSETSVSIKGRGQPASELTGGQLANSRTLTVLSCLIVDSSWTDSFIIAFAENPVDDLLLQLAKSLWLYDGGAVSWLVVASVVIVGRVLVRQSDSFSEGDKGPRWW